MKKLETGGTADSAENGGANVGGTLGSSMMKNGGGLKGKQKNLDLNKNGKLDSEDFKMIRGKMKTGGSITKMEKGDIFKVTQQDHQVTNKIFKFIEYNKEGNIKAIKYPNYYGKSNPVNIGDLTSNGIKILSKEEIKKIPINPIRQMANGGGLANVPESFPETDAISYKKGGAANDYYEQLAVYVQGVGSIYNGTSMKKAIDKANSYLKKNAKAEIVISDEKYGDTYDLDGNMIEDKMATGGSTKGFEYSIGGL